VALEHWGSSGFANTDLDLQLKKHGIFPDANGSDANEIIVTKC